jgi:hypothetical protein
VKRRWILLVLALCGVAACKSRQEGGEELGARSNSGQALPASAGHVRIVPAPAEGDVRQTVRSALADASGDLIVYVGASWCEPCRRFHEAALGGELDQSFPGLTLLEFDLDRDRERLAAAGYVSKYIPLFAVPEADGSASGKQIEGAIKGEGAVGFIEPRLRALLGHAP